MACGFGRFLLNAIIDVVKDEHYNKIHLEVNENNKPAIHLYEQFGFKQDGLRKKYYNGTNNAILMTLNL